MPHLLKEYAKNLGVRASKPIVKDHFFPILADKYITLSNNDDTPSKHYPFYDIVLSLLKPYLIKENIKVIQLGGKTRIAGADNALNLKYKQQCFVLSNSMLHVGSDGFLNHTASLKNIPVLSVFGNTLPDINKPLFSSSSKTINLQPKWDKRPCYNTVDPQLQINSIKPEIIAQNILDLLKHKQKINFTTLHVGQNFKAKMLEIVPTTMMNLNVSQDQGILIRADYGFNEQVFLEYCKSANVSICCDKLIQPHGLKQIANNVKDFFLIIDKNTDTIPEKYFRLIKSMNINLVILCEREEDVPILRNKYFDLVVKLAYPKVEKPNNVDVKNKFFTNKRIVCDNKEYLSYAHFKKGLDSSNSVLDTPEYWRDIENFYIYDTDKNSQEESR